MFLVDISSIGNANVTMNNQSLSDLWAMCFGYLNYRSLRLLRENGLVHGLRILKQVTQCEDYVVAK